MLKKYKVSYEKFEKLCRKNEVSIRKVCRDLGIATSSISDWKTGRSEPKADKLYAIARYFKVRNMSYFIEEAEE